MPNKRLGLMEDIVLYIISALVSTSTRIKQKKQEKKGKLFLWNLEPFPTFFHATALVYCKLWLTGVYGFGMVV